VTADPLLLDTATAAARLNIGPVWLKKAVTRGEVQHTRVGRLVRFSEADIQAFLASRVRPAVNPRRKAS
jgi:excisionase family DNA binding protein